MNEIILEIIKDYNLVLEEPESMADLDDDIYYVYVLAFNGNAIVLGHGRINRAKIIFDIGAGPHASGHLKAMLVRVYKRYYRVEGFRRYVIKCSGKQQAKDIEKQLHGQIGGNANELPEELKEALLAELEEKSFARLFLNLALLSGYDGLSDLKKWRRSGLIADDDWQIIVVRLGLEES